MRCQAQAPEPLQFQQVPEHRPRTAPPPPARSSAPCRAPADRPGSDRHAHRQRSESTCRPNGQGRRRQARATPPPPAGGLQTASTSPIPPCTADRTIITCTRLAPTRTSAFHSACNKAAPRTARRIGMLKARARHETAQAPTLPPEAADASPGGRQISSAPSCRKSAALVSTPPGAEKPPNQSVPVTRWQGMRIGSAFCPQACPTACAGRAHGFRDLAVSPCLAIGNRHHRPLHRTREPRQKGQRQIERLPPVAREIGRQLTTGASRSALPSPGSARQSSPTICPAASVRVSGPKGLSTVARPVMRPCLRSGRTGEMLPGSSRPAPRSPGMIRAGSCARRHRRNRRQGSRPPPSVPAPRRHGAARQGHDGEARTQGRPETPDRVAFKGDPVGDAEPVQ